MRTCPNCGGTNFDWSLHTTRDSLKIEAVEGCIDCSETLRICDAEEVMVCVEPVIDLWNKQGGWIPGVAYEELAEALGIDTNRLILDRRVEEGQS